MSSASSNKKWDGATLARTLSGDVPVFLAHRSYQNVGRLPEVLDYLGTKHGDVLGLGTVMRLPNMTKKTAVGFMDSVSHVPTRIVDPELWRIPDTGWPEAKALNSRTMSWTYLHKAPPKKVSRSWVQTALDVQRDHGASVLLSATGWVSEANATDALSNAMQHVWESRSQARDMPMWVNLTMDSKWLSDQRLRDILLNEIVESTETDWYLRFYWPEIPVRYGQLLDESILRGYKELASECALEDKRLYLPNTGLTGWLATALGASGFSTGQGWKEQAFSPVSELKIKGQRPTAIPRFFDSKVMHTLEFNEFERLRSFPDHQVDSTPFWKEIASKNHSKEVASLHYLAAAGNLTALLAQKRPNVAAYKRAKDADAFANSLSLPDRLAGKNTPSHLRLWMSHLKY